jgi:hypothetical protein
MKKKIKDKLPNVTYFDNGNTVIVEGIGKATGIGKPDMEKLITSIMSKKSFWK